jgi:hypothetical protein
LLDHPTCCPADQESLRDIDSAADSFPPSRPRFERHPARTKGHQSRNEHKQRQYDASKADNILKVIEK